MLTWLNGRFVEGAEAQLPLDDGAILFGDSLFETLRVEDGHALRTELHLDRLERSARLLGWPSPLQRTQAALAEMLLRLATGTFRLRLTLTRGRMQGLAPAVAGEPGALVLRAVPYQPPATEERERGVCCVLAPNRRVNPLSHLPQMKRGNYVDCLCAAAHARQRGAREALFVDDGRLLEGATTNLFVVHGGALITPPLTDRLILAGTMRRQVLTTAAALGWPVREQAVELERLGQVDEMFLTNSLIGLLPVRQVEEVMIPHGERWRQLLARSA